MFDEKQMGNEMTTAQLVAALADWHRRREDREWTMRRALLEGDYLTIDEMVDRAEYAREVAEEFDINEPGDGGELYAADCRQRNQDIGGRHG